MDLDVFVSQHQAEWSRLEQLTRKASSPRNLSGAEVDELVELYQRTATHLSVVQSSGGDPALVGRLSSQVARGRNAVTGTRRGALADVKRFLTEDFPATVYRARFWWFATTFAFFVIAIAWAAYLVHHPELRAKIASPAETNQLVNHEFKDYYKQAPARDFAFKVWLNNAYVAALSIASGALLGLPIFYLLYMNATNVGLDAAFLISGHRTELFFGLILPHGLLELTTIFVASGLGLKFGWAFIDPGRRTRSEAIAAEGRSLVVGAIGTALMLFVSGMIEGFVTPSPLPTFIRIGIGAIVELAFLYWVFVIGRRAAQAGVTGDLGLEGRGDSLPTSG